MLKTKPWLDQVVRLPNLGPSRHGAIRLDKSERTVPFPAPLFREFLDSLRQEDFIAYPETFELTSRLARLHGVQEENIFLSPGTDVAIKTCYEIAVQPGDRVIVTTPCFPMYHVYARLYAADMVEISYGPDRRFEFDRMVEAVSEKTALVLLANPNSPMGNFEPIADVERLVARACRVGAPVLIDEAYFEFAPDTALPLVHKYDNLAVSRTFSKAFGGAGIRIGYVVGGGEIIGKLAKFRLMYEVNQAGVKFALFMLDHFELARQYASDTRAERNELARRLAAGGFDVVSSECNWIHLHGRNLHRHAIDILKRHEVLTKFDTAIPHEPRRDWIRLTIGPGLCDAPYMRELLELRPAAEAVVAG